MSQPALLFAMPTAAYYTLGCKINQYETEKIREKLEKLGFSTVSFASVADVYVINSCTVTLTADSKSRRAIRQAARRNPNGFVVATGCYTELEPSVVAEIEGVDLVVGNDEKETIPERILARFPGLSPTDSTIIRPRTRTRAVVKVQDGCSQFCAYCAVPYARNKQWSRPLPDFVSELTTLAGFGYKEVVLAGIRLGSYAGGVASLIRAAAGIDGIERIRLSSIEAWEIDDDLLSAMTESPKVCRHLHIPLQSGSGATLRTMNRPYGPEEFAEIVRKARKAIPELGLTTDVIVGFPGETDESFDESMKFVEQMEFSRLHVFRYSPRPGTKAASMSDQVPEQDKTLLSERMIETGSNLAQKFAMRLVGQELPILVESKRAELLCGFTDNYVEVQFAGSEKLRGQIVPVRIESAVDSDVLGSLNTNTDEHRWPRISAKRWKS